MPDQIKFLSSDEDHASAGGYAQYAMLAIQPDTKEINCQE